MKNITLILALMFVGVSASANISKASFSPYKYGEAFIFIEGGVEFAVYPNGEFDFHYNPRFLNTPVMHIPHPGKNISYNSGYNYDALVQYDDYGAVIQIEHVPVYYDHYGRILQAGDVIIRYNNRGMISRVGNMKIRYNRFNQPIRYVGVINHYNTRYIYRPWHQYYMRPHGNYQIVHYEPYRAYYEPARMNYYQYNNYYQNNNYYYNKNNFYRPGQSAVVYNYGRRTSTLRDTNSISRNTSATSNDSRGIATDNARRNETEVTRQRVNMEQHNAAVRAQRSAQNSTPQPRSAVATPRNSTAAEIPTQSRVNTSNRTSTPVTTQSRRTVERPEAVKRTTAPQQQNNVRRSSVPQSTPAVQRNTSGTVRNQSTPQRVQEVPTRNTESSGTSRRTGGIR